MRLSIRRSAERMMDFAAPRLRSQWWLGLVVSLLFAALWAIWTYWGRAPLAALGIGGAAIALLIFYYPILGAVAAAFVATANISLFVPGSFTGVMVLTAGIVIIRKLFTGDLTWRVSAMTKWGFAFFAWYLASILWCGVYDHLPDLLSELRGSLIAFLLFAELVRTPRHFTYVILGAGIGVGFTSVLVIRSIAEILHSGAAARLAGVVNPFEGRRFFGNWPEPNQMAHAFAPVVALNFAVLRTRLSPVLRLVAVVSACLGLVAILLSLSRGAFVCMVAVVFIVLVADKKYRWPVAVVVTLSVLLLVSLVPVDVLGRFGTILSPHGDGSFKARLLLIKGGLRMIEDSFPMGVGLGNFITYSMDYSHGLAAGIIAHNSYIEVMAEEGLVGMVLYLSVLLSAYFHARPVHFRLSRDDYGQNLAIGMVAAWMTVILGMAFLSSALYPPFWIILSLISARPAVFDETGVQAAGPQLVPQSEG